MPRSDLSLPRRIPRRQRCSVWSELDAKQMGDIRACASRGALESDRPGIGGGARSSCWMDRLA